MKRVFFISLLFLLVNYCYSQKHYFTTDTASIFEKHGINWDYSIEGEFELYYKEDFSDSITYISTQKINLIINDYFGYYQIIYPHKSGVFEVYEFEYKQIEWRGTEKQILSLPSKDYLGVEVGVLGIWEDTEEQKVYYALWWYDKCLYEKILYFKKIDIGDNL